MFAATKLANPDADCKAFNLAYRIALWKADSQKRGINPGSNLDAVDISLSPEISLKQIARMTVERTQTPHKMGCRSSVMTY